MIDINLKRPIIQYSANNRFEESFIQQLIGPKVLHVSHLLKIACNSWNTNLLKSKFIFKRRKRAITRVFSLKPKTRLTNDNSGKLILSGALLYSEFKKIGFVILRTCSRLK